MTSGTAASPTAASASPMAAGSFLPDVQPIDRVGDAAPAGMPIVALGASAGGVEALQRFFGVLPADTGCAYVVVMHLAPNVSSQLVHLLARAASIPVVEALDGCAVAPDHAYVIAPGQALEIAEGRLRSTPFVVRPARPHAVDGFMTSLALDAGARAIGVILTGTDGDGAIGMKAIKSEGGTTIAQIPSSATHAGMPTSAVATGAVDQQLVIEEIPGAIIAFVRSTGLVAAAAEPPAPDLASVLEALRRQVGLDFSGYKQPMLQRRVLRRMGLARVSDTSGYIGILGESREECTALAADFLISVTEFFREPEAWIALARDVLPAILETKGPGEAVRAWVPGCATGEEAYSLAMVLLEDPRTTERRLKVQVFATDIDGAALEVARAGHYPKTMESMLGPERRRRFFVERADERLAVRRELRECVTFAPQNLIFDPPFSRMDVVSCRNLLIYLQPEVQRRILQLLHFALLPQGVLALGKSESVGPLGTSFQALSHTARIFRRVGPVPTTGVSMPRVAGSGLHLAGTGVPPISQVPGAEYAKAVNDALREHRPTTALLTNRDGQTLYFYGPVRRYLEFPEGTPSVDLFAMLHPALRPQLRAAMHQTLSQHRAVTTTATLSADHGGLGVRMTVSEVPHAAADDLLLVTFDDLDWQDARVIPEGPEAESQALRSLEEELRKTKHQLSAVIAELEAANEELKVAN
ncbi:MAG TPA: chemotaxis protein CheB, partial [Burkholderiaceae bacterium]|nr:chemotaxis protein CheB [Burkholderiaceae bacterium]